MAVVDTAASLTTGNSWFFTWLAKKFPGCVATVYTSETHSPITLTGIVKSDSDGTKTSTELPVCFVFNLPYSMNYGTPTNLAVACGPDVSVNLILGLPFIAATQMVIDVAENVVECHALDCSPFPIKNKRARVIVPKVEVRQLMHMKPLFKI
jgi:3D (Asp-Asp-Asp) domain-containing protein